MRQIGAGRLKGKTDINPQWRYQQMTELYGLCGVGWKFEIVKRWTEEGSDGQLFGFVDLNLFVKVNGEWSDPIPGNGGDFLVAKETKGLYNNDEAYKMATTDALSSAMKMIGIAADVYGGAWDGSKFNTSFDPNIVPHKRVADFLNAWNAKFGAGYAEKTDALAACIQFVEDACGHKFTPNHLRDFMHWDMEWMEACEAALGGKDAP